MLSEVRELKNDYRPGAMRGLIQITEVASVENSDKNR